MRNYGFGGIFTIYIIANPVSGRGNGRKTGEQLCAELDARHIDYQIRYTQSRGHAAHLAQELCAMEDCSALCAIGGDGTFFEVLSGLDVKIPLCLIAAGTGNDFVRGAGLANDPMQALECLLSGHTAPFDYIQVNDQRCLNAAGLGFDIDVLENESRFRRYVHGRASYYLALITSLFHFGGRHGHVILDGREELDVNLFLLAAMNGKYIGGGMPLSLASSPSDGMMDVYVVKMMPWYAIPRLLYKYLKGRIYEETKYVSVYHCSEVSCQVDTRTRIQLDGEIQDILPVTIRLVPSGIRLFSKAS